MSENTLHEAMLEGAEDCARHGMNRTDALHDLHLTFRRAADAAAALEREVANLKQRIRASEEDIEEDHNYAHKLSSRVAEFRRDFLDHLRDEHNVSITPAPPAGAGTEEDDEYAHDCANCHEWSSMFPNTCQWGHALIGFATDACPMSSSHGVPPTPAPAKPLVRTGAEGGRIVDPEMLMKQSGVIATYDAVEAHMNAAKPEAEKPFNNGDSLCDHTPGPGHPPETWSAVGAMKEEHRAFEGTTPPEPPPVVVCESHWLIPHDGPCEQPEERADRLARELAEALEVYDEHVGATDCLRQIWALTAERDALAAKVKRLQDDLALARFRLGVALDPTSASDEADAESDDGQRGKA